MELDALFEEAKKRQKEKEIVEASGYYKGKINNSETSLEFEEEDENGEEIKEYDNSETSKKEKATELELLKAHNKSIDNNAEESGEAKKKTSVEDSSQTLEEQNNNSNDITLLDSVEDDKNSGKKNTDPISLFDENNEQVTDNEIKYENEDTKKTAKNSTEIEFSKNSKNNQESNDTTNEDFRHQKVESLLSNDIDPTKSKQNEWKEEVEGERNIEHSKSVDLKFADGEKDSRENLKMDQDEYMSYKKINDPDLVFEKDDNQKLDTQKVDKIETYYRSGGKSTEYDWDLNEENRTINLALKLGKKNDANFAIEDNRKDAGEISIDYRKMKEEFDAIARNRNNNDGDESTGIQGPYNDEDEDGSFKVIEIDAKGFDFSIEIINLIYQKETKAIDFYKIIANELITNYHAYPVFYTYKASDKKHYEAFDSFTKISTPAVSSELIEWWSTHKKEDSIFADYYSKTMTTWICREIQNKSGNGNYWEDVELPSWAKNELVSKKVELVFPYFDGVDRMGVAFVYFPFGLNPKQEKGIEVTLEMVRTLLLESIQRTTNKNDEESGETEQNEKKNILNMFSGFFKGNKAG